MIYTIVKHAHSGFRWLVLLSLLVVVISSIARLISSKEYKKSDKFFGLMAMSFTHLQIILGFVVYFISDKVVFSIQSMSNALLRFFLMEHVLLMIVGVVVITIGYSKTKKANEHRLKLKRALIFNGTGLLLILLGIPWPWQQYSAGWF